MRIIFFIACFLVNQCYSLEQGSLSPRSARRNLFSRLSQIQNRTIWENHKEEMFKYIENGAPINAQEGNNSMLSLAVEFDDIAMAEKLLKRGAKTDTKLCAYSDSRHACLDEDLHPQNTLFSRATSAEMALLLSQYNTPDIHPTFKPQVQSLDR